MPRQLTFDYDLDQLCDNCWEKPAVTKGLCQSCYGHQYYRAEHPKKVKSPKKQYVPRPAHDVTWYRKKAVERYGPEIIEDLESLKTLQYWNLTEVGKKYGFTREYARQLFKRLFKKDYRYYEKEKSNKRKSDIKMLSCANDPRYKVAEYNSDTIRKSAEAELLVFNKCKGLGFNVKVPCKKVFDIIINNFNVDVKSTTKEISPNKTLGAATYFHFGISPHQYDVCDFFICYAAPIKTFYVIPKEDIFSKTGLYVKATASKLGAQYVRGPGKYHKYKEAWFLLNQSPTTEATQ